MQKKILLLLLFAISYNLKAQTFTNSNLPIILINTDNDSLTGGSLDIPDAYKILSSMKIIFRKDSSRNFLTDQDSTRFLDYNGRIGIEIRGSSSTLSPKKSYGFTTLQNDNTSNNNVSILGMPKENDWVLNSLPFDPSLVRDVLSTELSRSLGQYASRCTYCELVINGNYMGLYVLMEKLKADSERINIVELTKKDAADSSIVGGFVLKADKIEAGEPVAWIRPTTTGVITAFILADPKQEDIHYAQVLDIEKKFAHIEQLIATNNASPSNGYPSVMDIPSFVDFMILNELASNVDAYQYSTFFHQDKRGKLRAGPIWDFNFTYGNDGFFWGLDRSKYDVWQFDNGDNNGPAFWKELYEDETFNCYLTKRWKELTAPNQPLDLSVISSTIDSLILVINEAKERDKARWGIAENNAEQIANIKSWLQNRILWISSKLTATEQCDNPVLPSLVISKINYNPKAASGGESDALEFIEITNNSNESTDLTGIYFRELGLTYHFHTGKTIGANEKIVLASDTTAYERFYGKRAFDQYTRNLSNKSYRLVLANAFGSVIDEVHYFDDEPWPMKADGKGYYLQLIDLQADNSLASNWIAASPVVTNSEDSEGAESTSVFPNPAQRTATIISKNSNIVSYEIIDMMGKEVAKSANIYSNKHVVELGVLLPNTYYIKIAKQDGSFTVSKIVKLQ